VLTDLLVQAVLGFVGHVFDLLPTASLASVLSDVSAVCHTVGVQLSPWNSFLPLAELLGIVALLTGTWLPALAIYVTGNWLWRHIPDIAGFGPGSG
jgi:hypothetical protein